MDSMHTMCRLARTPVIRMCVDLYLLVVLTTHRGDTLSLFLSLSVYNPDVRG